MWALSPSAELWPWLLLPAAFLAGGLAGHLLAGVSVRALSEVLAQYAARAAGGRGTPPALWQVLWQTVREPLLALLFGCSAMGVVALPGLLAAQGFLMAYAASALIRTWGARGLLAAVLWTGVGNLLRLAVVLLIALPGWLRAWELATDARVERRLPPGEGRRRLLFCLGGLLAAAAYEYICWAWLTPAIWSG